MLLSSVKHMVLDQAYRWGSDGADGYTIEETQRDGFWYNNYPDHYKDDTEENHYDEFLDEYRIHGFSKEIFRLYSVPNHHGCREGKGKKGSEDEYESYTIRNP